MATGTEALRKSIALVAGPLSERLRKNGRLRKRVMLEILAAFTPWEDPELFDSAQADAGEPAQRGYPTPVTKNESSPSQFRRKETDPADSGT